MLTIRRAEERDAAAIADIYNHYVRTSTATFDTTEKSEEDRIGWLEGHGEDHPVLVAEHDDVLVAWGSLSSWALRPAWSHTVEVSVYVDHSRTGSGYGPMMLEALVEMGRRAGHHALIAQIVAENEPSLKMAERAGFERVGTLKEVGYKFGRWLDLALVERVLTE